MDFNLTNTPRAGAPNASLKCAGFHCNTSLAASTQHLTITISLQTAAGLVFQAHQVPGFSHLPSHFNNLYNSLASHIECNVLAYARKGVKCYNQWMNNFVLLKKEQQQQGNASKQQCNRNDQKNRRHWLAQGIIRP